MQPGDLFAVRYRIVGELGRGGMGVVYHATDENLNRDVALKVVALSAQQDPAAAGRFKREAQALAALHHPGVVTVHDYGEADGELFLIMQLVHGVDLAQRLSNYRRLSAARTADLAEQVAAALDALHQRGLVHRDVKPSNVLLEGEQQRPVLCDFGLAKPIQGSGGLTTTGTTVGTVQYMAPEQLSGDPATSASDVYAFGCVLFHCLTGRPPFTGHDVYEVAAAHQTRPLPDVLALQPDLPTAVPAVLVRCLAKRPEERWPSAGAAAQALRAAVTSRPETVVLQTPAPPPPDLPPAPQVSSRRMPLGLLAGCAGVLLVAGLGGGLLGLRSVPAPGKADSSSTTVPSSLDAADQQLAGLLTDEYGECSPLPRSDGQLARLNCDRTPEGLATLHIVQWRDTEAMEGNFNRNYADKPQYRSAPCSDFRGGNGARSTGHVSSRTGFGDIACYVNVNDDAVILWQYDERALQLLAIRDDANSPALFTWWQEFRDEVVRPG